MGKTDTDTTIALLQTLPLRDVLRSRKVKQRALEDETGISQSGISNILNGRGKRQGMDASRKVFAAAAKLLGVDVGDIPEAAEFSAEPAPASE